MRHPGWAAWPLPDAFERVRTCDDNCKVGSVHKRAIQPAPPCALTSRLDGRRLPPSVVELERRSRQGSPICELKRPLHSALAQNAEAVAIDVGNVETRVGALTHNTQFCQDAQDLFAVSAEVILD